MKKRDITILVVSVVIGIILCILPPFGGFTANGMKMLGVFIPTIICWVGIGTGWTSVLSLTAAALLHVEAASVFSIAWGNGVTTMVIAMLIIVQVMMDSGAMKFITEWMLSRKIIHKRPYVFMFMLCLAITLIGTAVYAVIMCTFLLTLVDGICDQLGYTKEDKFYKALLLLSLWICTIMDGVWPFARPIPALLMNFLESNGYSITLFDWIKVSLPFTLICIIIALIIIKLIYRPDNSRFNAYDDEAIRERLKNEPMNISAKVSCASIIIIIICWLIPSLNIPVISQYFGGVGNSAIPYLCVMVMCFLKKEDGEPIIEIGKALQKVNWTLPLFIGTIMFFSSIVGKEEYGVVAAIGNFLSPIAEPLSTSAIIAIGLLSVSLLTNFMSSTVATTIVMTVFFPLLWASSGVRLGDIIVFDIMIGCISNCAYLTHAACPASGVVLSALPGKDSVKYNIIMMAFVWIFGILIFTPLASGILG